MSNGYGNNPAADPTKIHCPQCGNAMLVAPQHVQQPVACPHCEHTLEPWRVMVTMAPNAAPPTPQPPATPPPVPGAYRAYGVGAYSWRNRWVAGALGVLLGGFGVHRFYLGFPGIAVIQIVVTVLTLGTVGWIWGFIEGILCFVGAMRDVDGLPLRS